MKNKLDYLEGTLLAAPFLVLLMVWRELPAQVPIHWNLAGEVDRWSPAFPGIFLGPIFSLAVVMLCRLLPRLDPKLRAYPGTRGRMPNVLRIFRISFATFFVALFALQLAAALGQSLPVSRVVFSAILLLLALCGNYSGNLQPNYFVGIRTPWTLESAETWHATHRTGGRLLFFGSVALLLLQFTLDDRLFLLLITGAALSFTLWCVLYSWNDFRTRRGAA
ncbi:MAG: SdpI family protein [Chthoniobacterales bacterium]